MLPRQSHKLATLTILTSIKCKFRWTQVKQDAFKKIKRIVACNTLLTYPYFNETFKIYTDARAFQLGVVISHKFKHISFHSIKTTGIQQLYTVTEIELLIIIETLKEFRIIILGQKLRIYTDHKNITRKNLIPI